MRTHYSQHIVHSGKIVRMPKKLGVPSCDVCSTTYNMRQTFTGFVCRHLRRYLLLHVLPP